MNNKGQTLTVFILLLPIIIILISTLFELGNILITTQKQENEIKSIIKYGLKHLDDSNLNEKLTVLLKENIKGKQTITINENTIKITVKTKIKSLYKIKNYEITKTYLGYKDKEIKIKKEKEG